MSLSGCPLRRYMRCRPSSRDVTRPTARSTRRCFDTCGCARSSSSTRSFTGRSPLASTSRISRRRGSATALNASAVVATLAMGQLYAYMGICQDARFLGPVSVPSAPARELKLLEASDETRIARDRTPQGLDPEQRKRPRAIRHRAIEPPKRLGRVAEADVDERGAGGVDVRSIHLAQSRREHAPR